MKIQLKTGIAASTLCAAMFVAATPVEAGGVFGMHIGTSGFGVSVGVGDWSPYTASWANPQFSLDFNATLAGYGEWVWVGNLGRVWRPWVAVDWRPYTYGRWVRTTLGWTWVAYEPWGYIPHHYGSWAMCDFGWVWVPGYSYSCANVVWVRSGGYVGWYARPPRGWSHAARSYRRGYRDGYRDGWNDARYATYVDWHHMGSDNVAPYAVRHAVAARGQVQDYATPPTVDEVRRLGRISVTETRLSQRTVTMNGRRVNVARPEGVARSIEHHASETAAEALSPRALERRQPSVRPMSSSPRAASRARGEATEISSKRPLLTGGKLHIPNQSEQRDSGAMTDRRVDERTERATGPTVSRVIQSPQAKGSIGASRSGPSRGSAVSGRVRGSSFSTDSSRNRVSTPTARSSSSGSSTRTLIQPPSRTGSVSTRSARRSESAPRSTALQRTGVRATSPPSTVRTRSAGSASTDVSPPDRSSSVRRRQAATRTEGAAESESKSARQSTARRKR
jgi:hypothetical protein